MKIAQVVPVFPPYKSGIGNVAYHLSWELSHLGHQVTALTSTYETGSNIDESLPFRVERLRPWLRYGNAAFTPQLLWKLQDFDIVHLHYPFFGGAEMVALRDRLSGLKLVIHYHMDVVGAGIFKRLFGFHTNFIMPHILKRSNRIVVTSMDYARQSNIAHMLRSDPDKFVEIPLGVNAELFKFRLKNTELVERYGLRNKRVALFVGALDRAHYFKGVTYLIKAFQLIASNESYRLMIVGGGGLLQSYRSLATSYGLERKIVFTERVSDDWLPYYYNLADFFVLPSIDSSEAFGIVSLEAMASRLPVIASDLPGVRSVVQKDITGNLVKPKDIPTLARYMQHLFENPQICNRLGEAGRQRVLEKYAWSLIGRSIDSVYRSLS